MKKYLKPSIVVLFTLVLVIATATVAQASWYGYTHATFKCSIVGTAHKYDGNNVGLSWGYSTHNSNPKHPCDSSGFVIELQRKGWGWNTIGSVRVSRSGGGSAVWTNVGSGMYRFRFSKTNDGTYEYVTDIEMYSW